MCTTITRMYHAPYPESLLGIQGGVARTCTLCVHSGLPHMTSDLMDQGLCMYCYGLNPWVPLDPMDDSCAYTYIPYPTVARDKRSSCALGAHGLYATEGDPGGYPGCNMSISWSNHDIDRVLAIWQFMDICTETVQNPKS